MNRFWTTYFFEPISILDNPSRGPAAYAHNGKLIFQLEFDGHYLPVPEWENHKYRYRCMSCYLASGSEDFVFKTDYAKAKYMKDGPTTTQGAQMANHTQQHQIMLQWAKGWLEKRR